MCMMMMIMRADSSVAYLLPLSEKGSSQNICDMKTTVKVTLGRGDWIRITTTTTTATTTSAATTITTTATTTTTTTTHIKLPIR